MAVNLTHTHPSNHMVYEYGEHAERAAPPVLAHVASYFKSRPGGWTQTLCGHVVSRDSDWAPNHTRFALPQRVLSMPTPENIDQLATLYPSMAEPIPVAVCQECVFALRENDAIIARTDVDVVDDR